MTYNAAHQSSGFGKRKLSPNLITKIKNIAWETNYHSERIIYNIESERLSMGNNNIDFINDWVNNVTIENEIWRGKKLRDKKPLPKKRKYEDLNMGLMRSTFNENKRHGRKCHQPRFSPRSRSPFMRSNFASSTYHTTNGARLKHKKQKRCSMRIAELAVPTKRQLLDTWRNKSNLLPEFMVDRLRQHVMDQTPIVKIPEALYCFQRRKSQPNKQCCFRTTDNKNNVNAFKPLNRMDTRTLCVIFGHKIAKRLSIPLNITLNSKLQNLSRIVANDIEKITTPNNQKYVRNSNNEVFQTEASEKVTIWIADILEDLTLKLLEEDLRVIKENEAKAKTAEQLVSVLEKVLRKEQETKTTDLEEEEGPVLDFIDDLVDSVMSICEPSPVYIDEESESSESSKDEIMGEESERPVTPTDSTDNKQTTLEEIYDTREANTDTENTLTDEVLTDSEHFRKEINMLIDNIDKESEDDMRHESADDVSEESGDDDGKESDVKITKRQKAESENENDKNAEDTDAIAENINRNNETDAETNNSQKNDSNVSQVFELFTEDSGDDKNSKKVKFSVTDLVNPDHKSPLHKIRTEEEPESDEQENPYRSPNGHYKKPKIINAEPNEHLLSDADESWPPDIPEKPLLKLSESVSKSITSLGNIIESEEKQFSSTEAEKLKTADTVLQDKEIIKETLRSINNDIGSQSDEAWNKTSKASAKTSATKFDSNKLDGNIVDSSIVVLKTPEKRVIRSAKQQNSKKPKIDSRSSLITNGSTQIVDGKISTHQSQSQVDYSWKVYPKTAPSWVTSWGYDRGEPSEDSIPILMRTKATESDMRKWCKDLDKAFINLEMWRNWISSTCKETSFLLKQKENAYAGYNRKGVTDWIRLKKNINKDAILWTKLYQRTEDNFKNLRRKYRNIEFSSKNPKPDVQQAIIETMYEFESLCVALHRMIVSAEFCAMCACKKNKAAEHPYYQ